MLKQQFSGKLQILIHVLNHKAEAVSTGAQECSYESARKGHDEQVVVMGVLGC